MSAPARDPNGATWYVLRYATDFRPRTDPSLPAWTSPQLGPGLFYDERRHVLELLPQGLSADLEPLPGTAVGLDGRTYRVDPVTGRVLVRCGETEQELVREPGVIGAAAGLALDRRGLLYVADPAAGRVLVVDPHDGSLAGALAGGLEEPVDVAALPGGRMAVADRRGGRIVVFDGSFVRCASFAPRDAEGTLAEPRPVLVAVDDDGALLVADARHPRLLRFTAEGRPCGTEEPHALLRGTDLEGACRAEQDPWGKLALLHRALRLTRQMERRTYPACDRFVSAALDGGFPGTAWHKVVIDADLPEGTWLKVETVTADDPARLGDPTTLPGVGEHDDLLELAVPTFVPFEDASCAVVSRMPSTVADRLVFSPPGRYLRLRLTLGSDGGATPTVREIRVYHPRASYLDLLPRAFRRDRESAFFLEHFLALFEHVLTGVEERYERFTRQLDPAVAPREVLDWLGCLLDLAFDPSWPLHRRRALVAAAIELYAARGTPRGLARYVEIYTGIRPAILEGFLERPGGVPFLGKPGILLGGTTHLAPPRRSGEDESLLARWAHRFTVVLSVEQLPDSEVMLAVVDRIVRVNKPAHTVHRLRVVRGGGRVGEARVGIDALLGTRGAVGIRLGGCAAPAGEGAEGSVLGADAVLGRQGRGRTRATGLSI